MTNSRMVPVGKHNPTVFVRTDQVVGMEIYAKRTDAEEPAYSYVLRVYLQGERHIETLWDNKYEAAQAACYLGNKINEDLQ